MSRVGGIPHPFINKGDAITAKALNKLAQVASRGVPAIGTFQSGDLTLSATRRAAGGTTTVQGGSVSIKIVLIDDDIEGVTENDPPDILEASEIALTEDEIADGWVVKFQDPPSDTYTENWVDELNLFRYRRVQVDLKTFATRSIVGVAQAGSTSTTIKLEATASNDDDYYNGDVVAITGFTGEGQSATITDYNGSTKVATIDPEWETTPNSSSEYEITGVKNSSLNFTTVDDTDGKRKIVRYSLTSAWYDDGKPFLVGEYGRSDYPTFPESDAFPPAGLPEGFLKRRYRGVVINGLLITAYCKVLPPPELPEA